MSAHLGTGELALKGNRMHRGAHEGGPNSSWGGAEGLWCYVTNFYVVLLQFMTVAQCKG